MNSDARMKLIIDRMQEYFLPEQLNVTDDSDKHRVHAGRRDGAGR